MRFIMLTLLLLSTNAAYATSPEQCLNLARDYLIAVDKNQSDTQIVYARENFLAQCKTDAPFNQNLTQLVVDNKIMKAIHVRQSKNRHRPRLYAI
jgi:hypothetical protein